MKYALLVSVAALRMPFAFNNGACETVTVMRDGGPVQVNKHDYDEKRDGEIFKGDATYNADGTRRAANPVTPSAPSFTRNDEKVAKNEDGGGTVHVGNLGVMPRKKGRKELFFVIDTSNGRDVTMDGIDGEGYASNVDAWKAITDAQANAQTRKEQAGDDTDKDADRKTNPDGTTSPAE